MLAYIRKRWLFIFISLAVLACLLAGMFIVYASGKTRILPLGDSITYGQIFHEPSFYSGYRGFLAEGLEKAGIPALLVGTRIDVLGRMHNGYPGMRIDELDARLPTIYNLTHPDITLLQIGTNDLWQRADAQTIKNRLESILNTLQANAGEGRVLVATVPPVCSLPPGGWQVTVPEYNALLESAVATRHKTWKNLIFVDLSRLSSVGCADMNDDKHPNNTGYRKMAQAWLSVLLALK